MNKHFFKNFDFFDFIAGAFKLILGVFVVLVFAISIIAEVVEYKYIENGSSTYHIYEDCGHIKNKHNLRRVKSKEIRENDYTRCKSCERRKERHQMEREELQDTFESKHRI